MSLAALVYDCWKLKAKAFPEGGRRLHVNVVAIERRLDNLSLMWACENRV